jgi:hypothetical protein
VGYQEGRSSAAEREVHDAVDAVAKAISAWASARLIPAEAESPGQQGIGSSPAVERRLQEAVGAVANAIHALVSARSSTRSKPSSSDSSSEPFRSLAALTSLAALLTSLVALGVLTQGQVGTEWQQLINWTLSHQAQLKPTLVIYAALVYLQYGHYSRTAGPGRFVAGLGALSAIAFLWVGSTQLSGQDGLTGLAFTLFLLLLRTPELTAPPRLLSWIAGATTIVLIGFGTYFVVTVGPLTILCQLVFH